MSESVSEAPTSYTNPLYPSWPYMYEVEDPNTDTQEFTKESVNFDDKEAVSFALKQAEENKHKVLTVYRESDSADGLPFVILWEQDA